MVERNSDPNSPRDDADSFLRDITGGNDSSDSPLDDSYMDYDSLYDFDSLEDEDDGEDSDFRDVKPSVKNRVKQSPEKVNEFREMAESDISSDDEDELAENINPHENENSGADMNSLMLVANMEDDDNDHLAAVRRQMNLNKQNEVLSDDIPSIVYRMDDPIDYQEERQNYAANAGDGYASINKWIMSLAAVVGVILVGMGFLAATVWMKSTDPDLNASVDRSQQTVNPGEIIGVDGQSNSESNSDDGGDNSTDDNSSSNSSDDSSDSTIYEVNTEGDISAASVSYIGGAGAAQQETGISLPWTKSVKASKTMSPKMAVTSSGRGTLTCTITKNGKEISTKTSSGESPSVECSGD